MKSKKVKLYGLRRYWPTLSAKEAENARKELFIKQNKCCAICKKPEKSFKRRLSVDHNHRTGKIRGLLCYRCNRFIVGKHDLTSALRLLIYLEVERE